VTEVAR